jgi:TolB-like protein
VVRQSVPDEVEDVVMQALEKTPADRFQTMKEFAERLSEAEAEAAVARTAQRRASTAARRASQAAARTTGATARRRTMEVEAAPAEAPKGQSRVKLWSLIAGGVVLVAGIGFGAWRLMHRGGPAGGDGDELDPRRIAVLYFQSPKGSDSLSPVASGLTENLIHELSRIPQLQVISSNGVQPYRTTDAPLNTIAKTLQVGSLVHGDVAQSGDRLRVTVSLINASTGAEVGSTTIEQPRTEIFALLDSLSNEVSIFLRKQLGEQVTLRETRRGTSNAQAWELLQRAEGSASDVDTLIAAGDTAAAGRHLSEADSILAAAEALDPTWSSPAVQRGWLAYRRTDLIPNFDKTYYSTWLGKGLEHADQALKLKPNDPDALELRGTLEYWRWVLNLEPDQNRAAKLLADAEKDLRAAVAANPTAAKAWSTLSWMLMGQSQTAEAKLAARRAYEADPYLSSVKLTLWRLFQTSLDLGDRQEANHWCSEGFNRFPKYPRFTECQIWVYALKDQPPDVPKAWRLLDEYLKLVPPGEREFDQHYGQILVSYALARAGLQDSARRVAQRARADAALDPTRDLAFFEAALQVMLNERTEAFRLLSTYLAANPQSRASMAHDETWWFRDLHSDARWKDLVGAGSGTTN